MGESVRHTGTAPDVMPERADRGAARRMDRALQTLFPEGLAGRTVLDFRCDDGRRLLEARRLGAGHCLGIDERAELVERARATIAAIDPAPDEIWLDTVAPEDVPSMELPYPCHVTLFFDLLEHLADPLPALRAAATITDRVMVLDTPAPADELAQLLRSAGFLEIRSFVDPSPEPEDEGWTTMLATTVRGLLEPVVRGKNGWLFLQSDSNSVLKQHSGEIRFSDEDLDRWAATLESRTERLGRLDIPHLSFIAPNKESIYSEQLPDDVTSAPERPVHQLLHRLKRSDPRTTVVYPVDELTRAKGYWQVYSKGDTHWNGLGAFVAYRALAAAIAPVAPVNVIELDELEFLEWPTFGDLSEKLSPPEEDLIVLARLRERKTRLVEDNGVRVGGRVVEFERPDLEPSTCLMFGDSFAWQLFCFLAESFSRFVCVHRNTVDYEVVERESPDVVISQSAERFIIKVPDDDDAPPTSELIAEKRSRGRVLTPEEMSAFASLFSPEPDKGHWVWSTELAAPGRPFWRPRERRI
jgi:hypothetical protein